ncbi:MAG: hypothetical protein Q9209_001883 [Squamulea sp. 1 TL-2023]
MSEVFPSVTGTANVPHQTNVEFNNLLSLTDKKVKPDSLCKAKPDWYDGSDPKSLKNVIRKDLSNLIEPSTTTSLPCLPNFFAETKGPKGTTEVNERQAWYDGILGARGVHDIRSYIDGNGLDDGKAYVIAVTYERSAAILTFYTIHPIPSNDDDHIALYLDPKRFYEHRMTELHRFSLLTDEATYQQGLMAFRNARDWAQEQRDNLVSAANNKALSVRPRDLLPQTDRGNDSRTPRSDCPQCRGSEDTTLHAQQYMAKMQGVSVAAVIDFKARREVLLQ